MARNAKQKAAQHGQRVLHHPRHREQRKRKISDILGWWDLSFITDLAYKYRRKNSWRAEINDVADPAVPVQVPADPDMMDI